MVSIINFFVGKEVERKRGTIDKFFSFREVVEFFDTHTQNNRHLKCICYFSELLRNYWKAYWI